MVRDHLLQPLRPLAVRPVSGIGFLKPFPRLTMRTIVMIDSTCVRVHQHAATGKGGMETMAHGTFPGGLTSKIHGSSTPKVARSTSV